LIGTSSDYPPVCDRRSATLCAARFFFMFALVAAARLSAVRSGAVVRFGCVWVCSIAIAVSGTSISGTIILVSFQEYYDLVSGQDLHRCADCNSDAWIPLVVHVIPIVLIDDIDVVRLVPVVCPITRPWVNQAEPESVVLEAWVSANNHIRLVIDDEPIVWSKVAVVAVVGNAIAVVAAALLPCVVV